MYIFASLPNNICINNFIKNIVLKCRVWYILEQFAKNIVSLSYKYKMYNRSKFISYLILLKMDFDILDHDEHNFNQIVFQFINCERSEGTNGFIFIYYLFSFFYHLLKKLNPFIKVSCIISTNNCKRFILVYQC